MVFRIRRSSVPCIRSEGRLKATHLNNRQFACLSYLYVGSHEQSIGCCYGNVPLVLGLNSCVQAYRGEQRPRFQKATWENTKSPNRIEVELAVPQLSRHCPSTHIFLINGSCVNALSPQRLMTASDIGRFIRFLLACNDNKVYPVNRTQTELQDQRGFGTRQEVRRCAQEDHE